MPSERIQLLIDVVTGNSKSSLGKLKTDLTAADTAAGKLKVTGGALGDFFKRNLALGAASAGTAIATFAVKAVGDFQKVALQAGELRDSTGLAAEEASRLAEVAKDIGVPVEAVATSLNRMNRAASDTPEAFDEIGASIARNQDGTTDVNQTFLNTIEALNRIPDATKRAAAAQQIFGRGWQQIAELVGMGAEEVSAALASVEESKVIDDAEIGKARDFRSAMDELRGAAESAALMIGETLVPAITDLAESTKEIGGPLADLKEGYDKVTGAPVIKQIYDNVAPWKQLGTRIRQVRGVLKELGPDLQGTSIILTDSSEAASAFEARVQDSVTAVEDQASAVRDAASGMEQAKLRAELLGAALETETAAQEEAAEAARENAEAMLAAGEAAAEQADAFRRAADATYAQRDAHRDAAEAAANVQTVIDDEESSMTDLAKALDDAATSAASAADADVRVAQERAASRGETVSATRALGIFNQSLLDQAATARGPARSAIVDYIATMNGIPPEKASKILALIDEGRLERAKRVLNQASDPREATIVADAETSAAQAELDRLDDTRTMDLIVNPRLGGPIPRFASGGTTDSSGLALVGEQGPELAMLPGGTRIHTASRTRSMLSGGGGGDLGVAGRLIRRADEAQALAKALREQADATEDSAEASRLNEEASKAAARADNLFERAQKRLEKAANQSSNAVGRQADALRDLAEALRTQADAARAAADSDRERSASLGELVDAQLAYEDAAVATREALAHAARAFTTEGVTREQQAAAINDAQQAALQQAEAAVERERERAEAAGRRFTDADAARVRQRELERLSAVGGPVGQALKDLIKRLNFPQQIALAERAERNLAREAALLERAEKREERAGELDERRAKAWDQAMNRTGRVFEQLANDRLTPAQARKMIREAFAEASRAARGGRR